MSDPLGRSSFNKYCLGCPETDLCDDEGCQQAPVTDAEEIEACNNCDQALSQRDVEFGGAHVSEIIKTDAGRLFDTETLVRRLEGRCVECFEALGDTDTEASIDEDNFNFITQAIHRAEKQQ